VTLFFIYSFNLKTTALVFRSPSKHLPSQFDEPSEATGKSTILYRTSCNQSIVISLRG
jgi:hypothetical protein